MEYKLGNSKIIKFRGDCAELKCPSCNEVGQFGIFSNFERRLAVKPALLDLNTVYFVVCPNCAAVYGIDSKSYKAFSKGDASAISIDKLFKLDKFSSDE